MKKILILFLIVLPVTSNLRAQNTKLDSLRNEFREAKHDSTRCNLFLGIGYLFESTFPDSAMFYYTKSLNLSNDKNLLNQKAKTLNYIGLLQSDLGNFIESQRVTEESLEIFKGLDDKVGISNAYNNLGLLDYYQENYEGAIIHLLKAKEIYEKLNNKAGLSKSYNNLGVMYINQGEYDKALENYIKSKEIDEESGDKEGLSKSLINIGNVNYYMGNYAIAIQYFEKSLFIKQEIGSMSGISICYQGIGSVYDEQGNYQKALEYYFKSLRIDEEIGDKQGMLQVYNSIGTVFQNLNEYNRAIEYFNKSLEICEELSYSRGVSYALNNIALCYVDIAKQSAKKDKQQELYAKALENYSKSKDINESLGNKRGVSGCYSNMGIVYQNQGSYDKAIESYERALEINEEIGAINSVGINLINIATLYTALADSLTISLNKKNSYLSKAFDFSKRAYDLSVEENALPLKSNATNNLMTICRLQGKYQSAFMYAEIYIATKDSMFREEKTKAITEMQTKYETEKKQQEIEKQQLVIEKQEIDNRRQRNQRNFFIAGTFLLALLALVILRGYQQKKRSNAIITEKNVLLEQANEEIAAQRDLVTEQKEHIEKIHEELTSSIRYASRIQVAVLPAPGQMADLLGDHFILFKPKDIVSGDFFWATRVRTHSQAYPTVDSHSSNEKVLPLGEDLGGAELLIFCVADCTGHGVPGAFMSMLGVSFLNDIVHKENVTSAAEVLNHLRDSVIGALKQKGEGGEQKDGMDMGLCVIDTKTKRMQFAGGYNPCWIIPNPEFPNERLIEPKNDDESTNNCAVIQLKPDKMPIAIHKHMESYSNHEVQLFPGDQIYLMSDGFQDQFGGPQGKKFMVKNLRELVVANSSLPMDQQREALERSLEEWKSSAEQVDDVTILGLRI